MRRVRGSGFAWRAIVLVLTAGVFAAVAVTGTWGTLLAMVGLGASALLLLLSLRMGLWVDADTLIARGWLRTLRFGAPFTLTPAIYDGALLGDSLWRSGHLRMVRVVRGITETDLPFTLAGSGAIYRQIHEIEIALGLPSRERAGRRLQR